MNYSDKHLHIISFDIPFPPDYGGAIDVFYKIKTLAELGVKVHLHCFEYRRERAEALQQYCEVIYYYPRNAAKSQLFKKLPYIVISRSTQDLIRNLLKDDYPVLFEGLHSTFYLSDPRLHHRKLIVRTHNIEHDYYNSLARVEKDIFKRYYYYNEASKLESYENILQYASLIAAISPNETDYFQGKFGKTIYLPAFHSNSKVKVIAGKGDYALYHGNLGVGENNQAALFLVNEVFNGMDIRLIIAGSRPSRELTAAGKMNNVTLMTDLSTEKIHELIQHAHVNILPTFQPTGIKLKLLSALFEGRYCMVNKMMIENTGLESLCVVADSAREMKKQLERIFKKPFSESQVNERKEILLENFSNQKNVKKLMELVFADATITTNSH